MKRKLLEYLACPKCERSFKLEITSSEKEEIMKGQLVCDKCSRSFPITGGIPRIISSGLGEGKKETAEFFAKDWRLFPSLDLSLNRNLMQEYVEPMKIEEFRGKVVLEGGCGSGRNLMILAQEKASELVGLDLSESVDVAYESTKHFPNIHLVQGDILNPPFKKNFDVVFSVGVLHHLPVPRSGFLSLTKYLRPGGKMAITVYGRENNEWIVKYLNPLRKNIFSRFQGFSLLISFLAALVLYPVIRFIYRPLNENKHTKTFAQNRLFYNDFLFLLSKLGFKVTVGQIWDQITAPTANYHTKGEVKEWFEAAGLKNIHMHWRNRNCWNGVGEAN